MRLTLALLIAGCTAERTPIPDPLPLGACLMPEGGWEPGTGSTTYLEGHSASFEAVVVEGGPGEHPFGDCSDRDWDSWVGTPEPEALFWVILEEAGGARWHGAVSVVGGSLGPLEAASVQVDYAFRQGGFGPDEGHFLVSDASAWRLWVGEAGGPGSLVLPEGVSLDRGDVIVHNREDCGDWDFFQTRIGWDGASKTLGPGESATVGDASFTVGNHAESTESTCPDWFVASLIASGWR